MYANWNTFKTGVAALLYRNSAEAWIGLINKYDNAKGSVLLINSWGSIKVYRHYGSNGVQGVQTRLKRKDRFESK